jgi:methionyl-tRNA formyltransferase
MLQGTEKRVPQSPLTPATPHAPFITPADSQPDFTQETAQDIVRRHLALSHHKPLTTYLLAATRTVQIHDLSIFWPLSVIVGNDDMETVVGSQPGSARYHSPLRSILVRCAQGSVLSVPTLKSEFKSLMSAKSWWDGIQPHWKDPDGSILFTKSPAQP